MAGANWLLPAPRIECLAASMEVRHVAELGVTSSAVRVRSGTNRIVQVPWCVGRAVLMDCIQRGALAKGAFCDDANVFERSRRRGDSVGNERAYSEGQLCVPICL